MDTVKSQLEMLSESSDGSVNYISWRSKLNLALKTKDLLGIATGHVIKPAGGVQDEPVKNWLKKDLEAQSLICSNVDSSIAAKIANCITAKSILDKLSSMYGEQNEVFLKMLDRKFINYVYDERRSAVDNCMEIVSLAEQLPPTYNSVQEIYVMNKILSILPPKLQHLLPAWENVGIFDRTVERLIERIRLEDERQADTTIHGEGSSSTM